MRTTNYWTAMSQADGHCIKSTALCATAQIWKANQIGVRQTMTGYCQRRRMTRAGTPGITTINSCLITPSWAVAVLWRPAELSISTAVCPHSKTHCLTKTSGISSPTSGQRGHRIFRRSMAAEIHRISRLYASSEDATMDIRLFYRRLRNCRHKAKALQAIVASALKNLALTPRNPFWDPRPIGQLHSFGWKCRPDFAPTNLAACRANSITRTLRRHKPPSHKTPP